MLFQLSMSEKNTKKINASAKRKPLLIAENDVRTGNINQNLGKKTFHYAITTKRKPSLN